MKLRSTTKMAYQAAIAIAIAELVSWYFQLERGYWVTLTAMALTLQTWGESVKRAVERVTMTIIGGICGTGLYFILPQNHILIFIVLLVFVFFTVYLNQILYHVSVIFLTCFVVFLFAILGEWTPIILFHRIFDTVIGAIIAIGVGASFFSTKSNIYDLFINHWEKIRVALDNLNKNSQQKISGRDLAQASLAIRRAAISIRYELFFNRMSQRDFYFLVTQSTVCTHYVINIRDTYTWLAPNLNQDELLIVKNAFNVSCFNIGILLKQLRKEPCVEMLPVSRASELLHQRIEEDPAPFANLENQALGFFNLIYSFSRLNACLKNINEMLAAPR